MDSSILTGVIGLLLPAVFLLLVIYIYKPTKKEVKHREMRDGGKRPTNEMKGKLGKC